MSHAKKVYCAFLLFLCSAVFGGCGGDKSPTGPSGDGYNGASVPEWSPYLGVHPYGFNEGIQQPYLEKLIRAGAVRGLRMDVQNPDSERFAQWALSVGIEDVVAVFPNEYLRSPHVWDVLAASMRRNPNIRHWEIGNEVDLFIQMTPQEYMPIFRTLFLRARQEFPDAVLIPQAIVGAAPGDQFLGQMLDAGLLELARHPNPAVRLEVIAIHHYSDGSLFSHRAKAQLDRLPSSVEVWVTETGVKRLDRHVEFTRQNYPRMHTFYRATRIYWYVLSECSEFSLVMGLPPVCAGPVVYSPLFQALTGEGAPQ